MKKTPEFRCPCALCVEARNSALRLDPDRMRLRADLPVRLVPRAAEAAAY